MKKDISMNILNNVNELHLFWNIRDFLIESPRQSYKKVIEHLKYNFKIQCNRHCTFRSVFFGDNLMQIPVLMRSTRNNCTDCGGSTSYYSHRFCAYCSSKGTTEYNYHHRLCRGFIGEHHPITNPVV